MLLVCPELTVKFALLLVSGGPVTFWAAHESVSHVPESTEHVFPCASQVVGSLLKVKPSMSQH